MLGGARGKSIVAPSTVALSCASLTLLLLCPPLLPLDESIGGRPLVTLFQVFFPRRLCFVC